MRATFLVVAGVFGTFAAAQATGAPEILGEPEGPIVTPSGSGAPGPDVSGPVPGPSPIAGPVPLPSEVPGAGLVPAPAPGAGPGSAGPESPMIPPQGGPLTGPSGGLSGPSGPSGPLGPPMGPSGPLGPPMGPSGPSGPPMGPSGPSGPSGLPMGPSGPSGPSGSPMGPSGPSGPPSGPPGPSGPGGVTLRMVPGPNGGTVPVVITPSGPEPVQLLSGPNGEPAIAGPNGPIPVGAVIGTDGQPLGLGTVPTGPVSPPSLNNPGVIPEPSAGILPTPVVPGQGPIPSGYYHSGAEGAAKVVAAFAAVVVAGAVALLV